MPYIAKVTSRLIALFLAAMPLLGAAQDRLPTMPRYDRYEKLRRSIFDSVVRGSVNVRWSENGRQFSFSRGGVSYVYDVTKNSKTEGDLPTPATTQNSRQGRRRGPDRGRQFDTALSADGKWKAVSRDRNVTLSTANGDQPIQITTDGSTTSRIKYGIASWVYGEELEVREAMWFSPDSKKLAFYRFDESKVPDYYLTLDEKQVQSRLDVEPYPKAGAPNPAVQLLLYDLESGKTTRVDSSFGDASLGEYVYNVRWSPKGDELLYNRCNRRQNTMELCAASPDTGASRAVVREANPNGWIQNSPAIQFLADGNRFLWVSERNGFRNIYLYDISGRATPVGVTQNSFDLDEIKKVDEKKGLLWYTARSAPNPYLRQLHRVKLNGSSDVCLTDKTLSHTVDIAPDGDHFIDVAEAIDTAPITYLRDAKGKELAKLAESDLTKFEQLGLKKAERFTFKAADGQTVCYGTISFPSDFDPSNKWPVLVGVYGGPDSGGGFERFATPDPATEFGFLHVSMDGRGTNGRGLAFRNAVYQKLGVVEIDDHAAGVLELAKRPYVDGKHVGIYGTSYGGYFSTMALLRHPEAFAAACASSPVTDWRNYDTIYTERYMWIPQENAEGYDAGSAVKLARNLKGRLMLYFGTADNNVHPSNTLQLVAALQSAGKSFDLMAGPDLGHTGLNQARMWEFFIDNLMERRVANALDRRYVAAMKRRTNLSSPP